MDQVQQVREKTDIVALLQEYITLKKAGRNFKANCPFHGEKTPSFVVSPERQMWHCFGCQKGGDVFSFLMEYEHMEFPEALRTLAEKAGVMLQNQKFDSQASSKREKIYAINHLAAEYYHYLLTQHEIGKKALAYCLTERKMKPQTVNTYMLGFAPPSGNALVTYLIKKKHYTKEEVLEAGLASPRGNMLYDFFQGRLIFPLYDHRDNIIGFSGRILESNDNMAKYVNTRETLVYHKGSVFFGLNSAKKAIREDEWAIIMEGEFDVISSFQEGITNVVAVKGTALTPDQVNLLSRFAKKISLCFDADKAGQDALRRSVVLLEKKGLITTVIRIPNAKDADEAIKEDPIAFKKAIKNDIPVYDYILEGVVQKYGTKNPIAKKQIGDEMLPLLSEIDNEIVKEHYLQLLGRTINTSYDALVKAIERLKKQEVVKRDVVFTNKTQPREERLEEYLLALVLQANNAPAVLEKLSQFVLDYTWRTPSYQKIIHFLQKYCESHSDCSGKDILPSLPQELLPAFDTCFLLPLPQFESDELGTEEAKKIADQLYALFIREEIKRLGEEIKQKEKDGELEELAKLQAEFAHFVTLLGKK